MSRYRFRLETVLRVRRVEEEGAKHALRAANMALAAAIDQRDHARARYRAFADAERDVCTLDELLDARLRAGLLADEVARCAGQAMDAARAAALARAQWSFAARRVAILERLCERRRAEHVAEELRAEAAIVDDIVTSRYLAEMSGEVETVPA